jgi:hypothetical protein
MYSFKVQGNDGVYDVIIDKKGDNLIATCTCANAVKGMICSHRRSIIKGYDSNVIENRHQVKEIPQFVANTKRVLVVDHREKDITVAAIKSEIVKNCKIFYYERSANNLPWIRIGKPYFDYAVKENKDYAIGISYDNVGSVIFMSYVRNSELLWEKYNINPSFKEISNNKPEKQITTLKVTIDKNGKPMYYERSGENGYWSRIEKSFFEQLVSNNKNYAIEKKLDKDGSIIFLKYEFDAARGWEKYGLKPVWENSNDKDSNHVSTLKFENIQTKQKGCLLNFLSFSILLLLTILISYFIN